MMQNKYFRDTSYYYYYGYKYKFFIYTLREKDPDMPESWLSDFSFM